MRHFKKIMEDVSDFAMQQKEQTIRERMTLNLREFADKVAAFNKLGESLYGGGNFSNLAEELEEIAGHAEAYTLRETEDSPFDQVTIKRNMKELRGYTTEFKKVASEARALQERMTALYEDSGRVLGRYFEIKEYGQPDGMTPIKTKRSENDKTVNANPGIREADVEIKPCAKCGTKVKGVNDKYCSSCKELLGIKEGICEGCGKPMERCECANEGVVGEGSLTSTSKRCNICGKSIDKNWKPGRLEDPNYCQGHSKEQINRYKQQQAKKEGVNESMKLKKLMEDVNSDYPGEDWVKLDVPMLRYDVALDFEKDLKKKGFTVKRHDWKERVQQGQEFSEFFVKKDDFDEANQYAVGAYPSYDNDARTEKE